MRALWLSEGRLRLRDDLPLPEATPGEALVRVLRAGVCNTDLELVRGYYPFRGVPGHEFVGVVEGVGEHVDAAEADRISGGPVVGEINAVCGSCAACEAGRPTHCERRTVLGICGRDGAFAEFLCLPTGNLHTVPAEVSLADAVFCEPLAAALQILEQVRIGRKDRVLVVGAGKLGTLIAQTLALTGCHLRVVSRRRSAPARALEKRGVRTGLVEDLAEELGAEEGAYDVAVECTGNAAGFAIARASLRPRGTLVLKSTYAGSLTLDPSALVVDEITLIGSRCGPFSPALELLETGKVDVEPLVEAVYPLEDGVEAFEHASQPGALKVLLEVAEA